MKEIADFLGNEQFVAVPLVWKQEMLGVILADNFVTRRDISMDDVQFLSSFANRAASAITNIRLADDLNTKVEELKKVYQQVTEIQKTDLQRQRLAALGEMSSKVAHEIRNPLVSIGGFAKLIMNNPDSMEDHKRFLQIIVHESDRLENILKEVLDYVRPDTLDRSHIDLNGLIQECKMMVERRIEDQSARIDTDLDPEMPMVVCNPHQIKQALLNLMQNGLDAIGRNGVITVQSRCNGGDTVSIAVEDNGVGIPEHEMNKLFQAFYTTKSRGVGLGLSVTQQMIVNHNGTIEVKSKPGVGTRFTITLPVNEKEVRHDGNEK